LDRVEESAGKDCKNVKKMAAYDQDGGAGEAGMDYSTGGTRSRITTTNQVESGYVRVGTIRCSAFGRFQHCNVGSM